MAIVSTRSTECASRSARWATDAQGTIECDAEGLYHINPESMEGYLVLT